MKSRDDSYGDIFGDAPDDDMADFIRKVHGVHRRPFPPRDQMRIGQVIREEARILRGWQRTPWWRTLVTRPGLLVVVAGLILVTTGIAIATSGILDLGKPTNTLSTNSNFPISGFHRVKLNLRSHGKTEFLWIGTMWPGDPASAVERWPIVKALEQFGSFSGIAVAPQPCNTLNDSRVTDTACPLPTFDWSKARYFSRYITFIHRDLIDVQGQLFQKLPSAELRLFDRYVRQKGGAGVQSIAASIYDPNTILRVTDISKSFPFIAVGGYIQTKSQAPLIGDVSVGRDYNPANSSVTHNLPYPLYSGVLNFDQTRSALASGKTPSLPAVHGSVTFPSLVPDVNGEANVITALICHADSGRPSKLCNRPTIKEILKQGKVK